MGIFLLQPVQFPSEDSFSQSAQDAKPFTGCPQVVFWGSAPIPQLLPDPAKLLTCEASCIAAMLVIKLSLGWGQGAPTCPFSP